MTVNEKTATEVNKTIASNVVATLREALEFIKLASDDYEKYGTTKAGALDVIYEKACAALSAPVRNCDVGTPEEQIKRWEKFCFDNMGDDMNESRCSKCPIGKSKTSCKFDWMQMPYTEKA